MAERGCPRILLVDDDVNALAGLRRNLPLYFDVTLAIGAEEALGGGVICDPLALPMCRHSRAGGNPLRKPLEMRE
jgi:hypothetical protein